MSLLGFVMKASRGVVVLSIVAAAVGGAGAVTLLTMLHRALGDDAASLPRWYGPAFAALCVVVAGSRVIAQGAMARLGQGAVTSLGIQLCRKILGLPLDRFEALDKGGLLAVLTEDTMVVSNALVGIPQICLNGPLVALCLLYAGWLSPMILACGVAFAAVGVGSYLALTGPAMRQLYAARSGQDSLVNHFSTLIDGFRELKQSRARSAAFLSGGLEPAAAEVRDRAVGGQTFFALAEGWGELSFFGFLGFLTFVLPAFHPLDRATLAGAMLVVLYIMGPLDVLITWIPTLGRARASLRRIDALLPTLSADAAEDPAAPVPALRTSIELDGVTYDYPGEDGEPGFALGPVDLVLRPGELVLLAGGNGSGKTTLVKILAGLYAPRTGSIRVDGRPVDDAGRAGYRDLFTVIFADGHLLRRLWGQERPGLEAEAAEGLARMGLGKRVRFEGESYSTTDLSQGQRGRLGLLSALLENRPVLVLDEWAANQDWRFKQAFYREILPDLRAAGKALLVISHDETYHDVADRIVRLRDGRIGVDPGEDGGPHAALEPARAGEMHR
ncbi:cyclic peptide export ABC transporter [Tundrisphaera sp. TA3]|uniref:cyclic peptide export ABC transporter n=1 Tax=Tundrisphaera sp. TA3 TaxID=3435775 RepID=UPI003EBA0330